MTLTDFEEKENYYSVKKKKKQKANQIHHVINITVLWSYMYNRENWPENCLLGSHDTYYRCICLCGATWSMNTAWDMILIDAYYVLISCIRMSTSNSYMNRIVPIIQGGRPVRGPSEKSREQKSRAWDDLRRVQKCHIHEVLTQNLASVYLTGSPAGSSSTLCLLTDKGQNAHFLCNRMFG